MSWGGEKEEGGKGGEEGKRRGNFVGISQRVSEQSLAREEREGRREERGKKKDFSFIASRITRRRPKGRKEPEREGEKKKQTKKKKKDFVRLSAAETSERGKELGSEGRERKNLFSILTAGPSFRLRRRRRGEGKKRSGGEKKKKEEGGEVVVVAG